MSKYHVQFTVIYNCEMDVEADSVCEAEEKAKEEFDPLKRVEVGRPNDLWIDNVYRED
jgi:hypothetical protein